MNILFCVPAPITSKLGRSKVYVELSQALENEGCICTVVGRNAVAPGIKNVPKSKQRSFYQQALLQYINAKSGAYDVIDYGHPYLPFESSVLPQKVILVSRSVLLIHHAHLIRTPVWQGIPLIVQNTLGYLRNGSESTSFIDYMRVLKKHAGTALRYEWYQNERFEHVRQAQIGIKNADLVTVNNSYDVDALVRMGVDKRKVLRLPFGLSRRRRNQLLEAEPSGLESPVIAFVGTFDFRKGGATDTPRIASAILKKNPNVRFRLLGTRGLFTNRRQALVHFPVSMHDRIHIVPSYEPEELPQLLSGCTAGIFPSRFEGFPFGVLEMLAAGLPVMAYDSPGPPEMLPAKWLSELGKWKQIAEKVNVLLRNPRTLAHSQIQARSQASAFKWSEVARRYIQTIKTLKKDG